MTFLAILKYIALLGTIGTGVLALVRPLAAEGFTGLKATGGRGVTEIRAVFGGLFIVLGLAPLVFGDPVTFTMLGLGYLGIALVRLPAMFIDRSVIQSNIISLVIEVVFGIILVI